VEDHRQGALKVGGRKRRRAFTGIAQNERGVSKIPCLPIENDNYRTPRLLNNKKLRKLRSGTTGIAPSLEVRDL